MNPVYLSAGIVKEEMIGTKAASTLVMQVAKLVSFASLGLLDREVLIAGLWVGIGALVGNQLGKAHLARMSSARFRSIVHAGLAVAGLAMAARAIL